MPFRPISVSVAAAAAEGVPIMVICYDILTALRFLRARRRDSVTSRREEMAMCLIANEAIGSIKGGSTARAVKCMGGDDELELAWRRHNMSAKREARQARPAARPNFGEATMLKKSVGVLEARGAKRNRLGIGKI